MKIIHWFFLLVLLPLQLHSQYFEDAGRIVPYSETARLKTSGGINPSMIIDNNITTFWESEAVLPDNYFKRDDLNMVQLWLSPIIKNSFSKLYDGDISTSVSISKASGDGKFRFILENKTHRNILCCSFKTHHTDSVYVLIENDEGIKVQKSLAPTESYTIQRIDFKVAEKIKSVRWVSKSSFNIFEIAVLENYPTVFAELDLGASKEIGQIYVRYLSGDDVLSTEIEVSEDQSQWTSIAHLEAKVIPLIPVILENPVRARFIRLVHTLKLIDYAKASLWEFKVYDRYGPYGPSPTLAQNHNTMRNRIGINGFWGWGFNTCDDLLPNGQGSNRFVSIGNIARSYHNLNWDINYPGDVAKYSNMSQKGTQVHYWLDWDREYSSWNRNGLKVDACIQFNQDMIPSSHWKDPYREAYTYGFTFAEHFVNKTRLISMIEVGNEPWNYPDPLYKSILEGMSEGIKKASPQVIILPAAFQASFKQFEFSEANNYIGGKISERSLSKIDGLNGHFYSHCFTKTGLRQSVAPEDPRSDFQGIRNLLRFRDRNLPGKPVYITEFGYDSDGGGEDCLQSECVSEDQQAAWGLRAAILLLRNNAEQVYWYFFANENRNSVLHARSGLCASSAIGFTPKKSFKVFQDFQKILGDSYLDKVLTEDQGVYSYLFIDEKSGNRYVVTWSSHDNDPSVYEDITLKISSKVKAIQYLDDSSDWIPVDEHVNHFSLPLNGFPAILLLN